MPKKCIIATNICYEVVQDSSPLRCVDALKIINNIIDFSSDIDYFFLVNDSHTPSDNEFQFVPPHMIRGSSSVMRLYDHEKRIKENVNKYVFLNKKHFSALTNPQLLNTIVRNNFDKIFLCGFTCCMDILNTGLDMFKTGKKPTVVQHCCGDVFEEAKNKSLDIMRFVGMDIV